MTGLSLTQDGTQVVFSGTRVHILALWRAPVSATARAERLVLAEAGEHAFAPACSRQGHRLVYSRGLTDHDLWQIDASGAPKRLATSSFSEFVPQFSPDGRKIAFLSSRTGAPEIWVADQDGSNVRQLTFGSIFSGTPRWSPDGRWIAFDSQAENGRWDIYVVDAAGGQPRRVTQQEGINDVASWSRDGKWIYFSSDRSGRNEIMRIPAGGGEATQITSKGGHTAFESSDGASIYYTKGDPDTGLWRMPVGGGAEQKILESVFWRSFAVVEDGIYYIPWPGPDGTTSVQFHDFASGKSRMVVRIDKRVGTGLAVSPDRKRFIISRTLQWGSDLMLVENFR